MVRFNDMLTSIYTNACYVEVRKNFKILARKYVENCILDFCKYGQASITSYDFTFYS